jgi:uncharacterized protein YjbJ (UPF0337 family)
MYNEGGKQSARSSGKIKQAVGEATGKKKVQTGGTTARPSLKDARRAVNEKIRT